MGKLDQQSIESYLQREEVQNRIHESILRNRSHLTVPISGAVNLFGFGVNQLRKWEEKGLLNPQREGTHRQYSLQDLDKLAIIHELVDAKFAPGKIPPDIDNIWDAISHSENQRHGINQGPLRETKSLEIESRHLPINQRIETARKELFWRFYISFVLRISLQLIREDMQNSDQSVVGLVLPLNPNEATIRTLSRLDDLPKVGESFVGWFGQSGSSHTLFTTTPLLEHPERYRICRLLGMEQNPIFEEDIPADNTLLIVDGHENPLNLNSIVVNTIRCLLVPFYEETELLRVYFDQGMRDALDPATDLNSNYSDVILNGLADMVIRLGNIRGVSWRFCCILLPDDTALPLQERSLVVKAQSGNAPHKIGKSIVSPNETALSISLRAYQSGQGIYRNQICEEDSAIALRELENPGSVIALPTGGMGSIPAAILYVVSDQPNAFDVDNQRILRLLGIAVEELLDIYRARRKTRENLSNAITNPENLDAFFENRKILSENDFVLDIETILRDVQLRMEHKEKERSTDGNREQNIQEQTESFSGEGISVISIDIDKQSQLASRYGDQFTRNLSKVVGSHLNEQLLRILTETVDYQLYQIWADRFYLVIRGLDLEETRKHAERIRRRLKDTYEVSVIHPLDEESKNPGPEKMQVISLSVRVAVTYYLYRKLEDLLVRYSTTTNVVGNVRACLLYTSPSPRDRQKSRMPSSA